MCLNFVDGLGKREIVRRRPGCQGVLPSLQISFGGSAASYGRDGEVRMRVKSRSRPGLVIESSLLLLG